PRGRARRRRPRGTAPRARAARRTRVMSSPIISADSHVTEPPNAYIDNIDPAYRDRAPRLQHVEGAGDMFVIEGLKVPIPLGIVQTAMRTPAEGIRDLESIKAVGLRGVMLPGVPGVEDYDSPAYDEFWEAVVALGLPPSFHILTTRETPTRGPRMNAFLAVIRGCQDIMGTLVLGGVFERHPKLRVVCVEADAGWVPHYMYRMDHAYKRHR